MPGPTTALFAACDLRRAPYPGDLLYDGLFDYPSPATPTRIPVHLHVQGHDLHFDLKAHIDRHAPTHAMLAALPEHHLRQFCAAAQCTGNVRHGHLSLHTQIAARHEISSCYVDRYSAAADDLLVVVALNETQPTRFKAAFVAVVKQSAGRDGAD